MIRCILVLIVLIALSGLDGSVRAQESANKEPRFSIEAKSALSNLSAEGSLSISVLNRTRITSREFGIGPSVRPELKFTYKPHGGQQFSFSISNLSLDGDQRLVRESQTLGVLRFRLNERIVSRSTLREWQASWTYRFRAGNLRVGPRADLRVLSVYGSLKAPEARRPLAESFNNRFVLPTFGLSADFRLHERWLLQSSFSGVALGSTHLHETEVSASNLFGKRFALVYGWKLTSFAHARTEFAGTLQQPFVGLALHLWHQ